MTQDRFGKAIGVGEIEVEGEKFPVRLKVGDVRNFTINIQDAEKDSERTKKMYEFQEKILKQGKGSELSDDEKLFLETHLKEVTEAINEFCGFGSKESKEKLEKLKN